jgi:AcrR family transcriptional regulator
MNEPPVGLRERKRAQTRQRLEQAAVDLCLQRGVDGVTVDAISEFADVSPRTFFNYFDCKEDAIVGVPQASDTEELFVYHRTDRPPCSAVEAVVALLMSVLGPSISAPDLRDKRMQLLRQQPRLLERHIGRMTHMHRQLVEATQHSMAQDPLFAGQAAADSSALADVLLMACVGGIRAAVREWAVSDTPIATNELERRAVQLVDDLTRKNR